MCKKRKKTTKTIVVQKRKTDQEGQVANFGEEIERKQQTHTKTKRKGGKRVETQTSKRR